MEKLRTVMTVEQGGLVKRQQWMRIAPLWSAHRGSVRGSVQVEAERPLLGGCGLHRHAACGMRHGRVGSLAVSVARAGGIVRVCVAGVACVACVACGGVSMVDARGR